MKMPAPASLVMLVLLVGAGAGGAIGWGVRLERMMTKSAENTKAVEEAAKEMLVGMKVLVRLVAEQLAWIRAANEGLPESTGGALDHRTDGGPRT